MDPLFDRQGAERKEVQENKQQKSSERYENKPSSSFVL